jgi:hypothetical protein
MNIRWKDECEKGCKTKDKYEKEVEMRNMGPITKERYMLIEKRGKVIIRWN